MRVQTQSSRVLVFAFTLSSQLSALNLPSSSYIGRLAPSPTGHLHLGHARTFWLAAERARAAGGTLLLRNDDLDAIRFRLDFVAAMIEDLRWLCVKAWRFGSPHPVAGLGSYEQLITAYEDASGTQVDPDVVRWWEVLGTLKWGIMCIGQANAHISGAARSHELAAIGRRVCENEHDLFLALEGRW